MSTANTQNETSFINSIDCNFPYEDNALAVDLINKAALISSNAIFAVLEEICRAPRGKTVTSERQLDLLNMASALLIHPLKDIIIESCMKLIKNETAHDDEIFYKLHLIKEYPNQYCAMNIVYFTGCPGNENIDAECDKIINYWNTLL
jgi:hypothetical protein